MTDTDDPLTLARTLLDALNQGDRAGVQALLAENVTERQPLEQEVVTGPEAVVASIWSFRNSFPDLRVDVTDGFASGDPGSNNRCFRRHGARPLGCLC